jgi:hypothetical protein
MKAFAVLAALALGLSPLVANAAPYYQNDFEADTSASWAINNGPSDSAADFFFDYSTVGIPSAPNSSGGSTRGMKLQANQSLGMFSGMSVSPTGQSFSGDYALTFDWWANFNGPFPAGGNGSTQLSTYGIGTSGGVAQWPGATHESVWFGATGDGGSSADWRAYSSAAVSGYQDTSGVYAAGSVTGSRNSSNAYYAGFGGNSAPAAQVALYAQQTGATAAGSAGMEWHQVRIDKIGNLATWKVDDVLIATIDLNTVSLGGGNIFFGHSDINATSSSDPNDSALLFTLVDNIAVVPEPGTLSVLGAGIVPLLLGLRRRSAR